MHRARRIVAAAAALSIASLVLAGCAAGPGGRGDPTATSSRLCSAAKASALDCGLYVAVRATAGGTRQTWLPTEPIRLWFERLNGARTAILDAPVNTSNVPTITGGSTLWHAGQASVSAVGCGRHCEADAFVGAITDATASYRVDPADGAITITAAGRSVVFAPTAAPAHAGSCDSTSIDPLPCRRLVTLLATAQGREVAGLRLHPLTATVEGTRGHHTVLLRASDGRTWSVRLENGVDDLTSDGATASGGRGGADDAFVDALLRGRVDWRPHFESVLLVAGTSTLELAGV